MSASSRYLAFLADRRRVEAYQRAIQSLVQPGMVVADLGAGVGGFSVLAARAGARRVYAVESDPAGEWIPRLAEANGVGAAIEPIAGDSRRVEVPETVDLVIFDGIDLLDLRGTSADTLQDARDRWLTPDGTIIPSRLRYLAAPCQVTEPAPHAPIDLSPLRAEHARGPVRRSERDLGCIVGDPEIIAEGPAESLGASGFHHTWSVPVRTEGPVSGLLCWIELDLAPGIRFSNQPGPEPSVYSQMLFSTRGLRAEAGAPLHCQLRYAAPAARSGFHKLWKWSIQIDGQSFGGSTFDALELPAIKSAPP